MKKNCYRSSVVVILCALLPVHVAFASEDSLITAVYSNVSNGYSRTKLPDGSFKRENYAISNGGYSPGIARDESIDAVKFPTIAGVVAQYLARQNYYLAQDAKSADLLIVISWGTSVPFNDGTYRIAQDGLLSAMNKLQQLQGPKMSQLLPTFAGSTQVEPGIIAAAKDALEGQLIEMQAFNSMRDRANEKNAQLLGYSNEIYSRNNASRFAGAGDYFNDLISDIETDRYYVIISAYDFRAATQEKKKKLLWVTRVSIQAQGNRFNERLTAMMANASQHFGQDSGRLIRQYQRAPRVDLKELKFLGLVPDAELKRDGSKQK